MVAVHSVIKPGFDTTSHPLPFPLGFTRSIKSWLQSLDIFVELCLGKESKSVGFAKMFNYFLHKRIHEETLLDGIKKQEHSGLPHTT